MNSFTDLLTFLKEGSPLVETLFHAGNPSKIDGFLSKLPIKRWSGSHAKGTASGQDEKYPSPPSGIVSEDFTVVPPKTRIMAAFIAADGAQHTLIGEREAFSGKGASIELDGSSVGTPETNEIAYKDHLSNRSLQIDFIWIDAQGKKQNYRFDAYLT